MRLRQIQLPVVSGAQESGICFELGIRMEVMICRVEWSYCQSDIVWDWDVRMFVSWLWLRKDGSRYVTVLAVVPSFRFNGIPGSRQSIPSLSHDLQQTQFRPPEIDRASSHSRCDQIPHLYVCPLAISSKAHGLTQPFSPRASLHPNRSTPSMRSLSFY
jgi:hypothetical protein